MLGPRDEQDVGVGGRADRVDLLEQGGGRLPGPDGARLDVVAHPVGDAAQRRLCPLDPAADRGQRPGERVGQRGGQPLVAVGEERRRQHRARVGHAGDRVARLGEDAPQQPGQMGEPAGADLDAGGGGDHVVDHVRLVDDREVVLGEDGAVAGEVEPVEVEVDDHDVGLGGPVAGRLGEAAVAAGAPGRTGAVARRRADRGPGGVAGLDVELGAVAGGGGGGPRGDGRELVGVGALGQPVERQLAAAPAPRSVRRRRRRRRTGRAPVPPRPGAARTRSSSGPSGPPR